MSTRRKRVRKRGMEQAAIDTPKISPIEKLILAHKDSSPLQESNMVEIVSTNA